MGAIGDLQTFGAQKILIEILVKVALVMALATEHNPGQNRRVSGCNGNKCDNGGSGMRNGNLKGARVG